MVPGQGGNPVGGNLQTVKKKIAGLEASINYADLDVQLAYVKEKLNESRGIRPSYLENQNHLPPMPPPPKGFSSEALKKRGGRFTPGKVKLPSNPQRKEEFKRQ